MAGLGSDLSSSTSCWLSVLGNFPVLFVPQFFQLSNGDADANGTCLTEQVEIERGV